MKNITAKTLQEALQLLNSGNYKVLAGGTDLMVQNRAWSNTLPKFKEDILLISNLNELKYIHQEDGYIHIGSLMTLEELKHHELTPKLLVEALEIMASPAIRNMATIGGNIGNASPAGDSLPVLYVLNALVILQSINSIREIPIEEFILGPGKKELLKDEMITEIKIPINNFTKYSFKKVGGRKADAISKVSFAGATKIKNNLIQDFRVSFGAVGPTVVRKYNIENNIVGTSIADIKLNIQDILNQYSEFVRPIDDQRSNKEYRKKVAINLLEEFILNL
ncbi:MAG: FAD binding domain-containing protein [Candidatus Izimaplasma sp.]|nr:FAD binding domain-containing protein [Candidatus Izimaplasma bacterium]